MYKNRFIHRKIPTDIDKEEIVISKNLTQFGVFSVEAALDLISEPTQPGVGHHEVIFANRRQKLRFDIDDHEGKLGSIGKVREIVGQIIFVVSATLDKYYQKSFDAGSDLLVFTSSGTKNGIRIESFHLVFHNFFFEASEQAFQFFEFFCRSFSNSNLDLYSKLIEHRILDGSIYKGDKRQFRLVNSYSGERIKTVVSSFFYKGRTVDSLSNLDPDTVSTRTICSMSLITSMFSGALLCSGAKIVKKVIKIKPTIDVDMRLVEKSFKQNFGNFGFFSKNCSGNRVTVTRTKPSICPICNRRHDNDNMYVIITSKTTAKMYCYRDIGNKKTGAEFRWDSKDLSQSKDEDETSESDDEKEQEICQPDFTSLEHLLKKKKTTVDINKLLKGF